MTGKPTYEELERRVRELENVETERKFAEEALRESEFQKSLILNSTSELIGYYDTDLRIIWVNTAAASSVGKSPEEMIGSYCYNFWNNSDEPCSDCPVIKSREEKMPQKKEKRTPDGRYWSIRGFPILDKERKVIGLAEFCRDITERKRAEEALEAQRAQLKSLFDYSGEAIVLLDIENHILDANSGFERIFGYSPEEARGNLLEDLICPERFRAAEAKKLNEEALNGTKDVEIIRKRKDGEEIDVRVSVGPIKVGDNLTGRFVVFEDITERKQTEEALLDSEQKYRNLIENANEAIFVVQDQKLVFSNPKTIALTGYSGEELRSRPFSEFIHPDDRELVVDRHVKRLKGEVVPYIYSFRIIQKDGSIRWVELNAVLINWNGKKATLNFLSDITERKQTEDALLESEQRYRALFETTLNPIAIISTDHRYLDANPAFLKFVDKTKEELLRMRTFDFAPSDKKANQQLNYKDLWKSGRTIEIAYLINGEEKLLELTITPFQYQNQKAILGTGKDITESTKLQSQLRQAQKMESIGTLAGGIAHDFNNILSIIVGNTELAMLDLPEWSPARHNLKEIREATLRARDLVKQILLFARQKEQTVSNILLEPIVKESLKMLRSSIPTTVSIRESIEEGLPLVPADPSQIQQIIMNLCTNAAQVMEAEGGRLTFTLDTTDLESPLHTMVKELPPGRYVRMQVKDTGPGIPPENLERVFDPFFTTKGVGEGTGLGLAVVHGIVQDRSGGITVQSEEGRGTTFTVYLPASEVQSVEEDAEQKMELPLGTERVLFVDDEPTIMKLGQRMLERQGYTVETRACAMDALECFRQNPFGFDLVITDMTMPGMRGDRLAEEILAIRPDIPVILSTGYSKQISSDKAQELGIRAFVMKPLTQHELVNTVRRVLDEKSRK